MSGLWLAFKGLTGGMKLALIGGTLAFLLALSGGIYYTGYMKGHNESKIAVANYEKKVEKLQNKLDTAVGQVDIKYLTLYKDRIITNEVVKTVNRDVIKTVVPEQFVFSNGWVYAYNASVLGKEIDRTLAADNTPSKISDRVGLGYIGENNGVCLANAAQLDSLIGLTEEREVVINEIINSK